MHLVAAIKPFADMPGLVAYMCPNCGHAESRLVREDETAPENR
jgi:predicted RNA-binding Zn-ribbon protein involved in translation (DUF1610 family)